MKVKEYRLLNGYTQTEIANILNIKQNSYSNKELGKRAFTIEEIKLLKELFKVTYEDLLNQCKGGLNELYKEYNKRTYQG